MLQQKKNSLNRKNLVQASLNFHLDSILNTDYFLPNWAIAKSF